MKGWFPLLNVLERPLLLPLYALGTGIACGGLYTYFLTDTIFPHLVAISFLTLFFKNRIPFFISLIVLFFFCGNLSFKSFILPDLKNGDISLFSSDDELIVEGVIDSRPEATEKGCMIYLQVDQVIRENINIPVSGRLLVFIREGRSKFITGDRIRFKSRIQTPRNYGIPGEFDFKSYLAYRKIYATAFAKSPDDLLLVREGVGYPVQRAVDSIAANIGIFIDKSAPPLEASILRALLIGDMGYVPKATKDAYSRTGVNHILSISGFHVGIIALFIFQLIMLGAKTSEFLLLNLNLRRFVLLLTLPILLFYLFLSGAAPATVRSLIMIGFYIVTLMLEREVDPVNSLMLAALFILVISPPALFDLSFQLSFLAFWGLLVLTPLFMMPFNKLSEGIPRKLLLFFLASAAATGATLLTVAYYFHRVSWTGLISNFFIVPLMGYGAVVIGFSALPFYSSAPIIAKSLILGAAWLVKISNGIFAVIDKIPTLTFLNPSRIDLLLFYILLSIITFIGTRKGKQIFSGALSLLWIGSVLTRSIPDSGKLVITMFSVGQGESTLISFADGKRMLVDGGGNVREGGQDVGERLLAPALWRMGVKKLDYVVLSHPHPDHMQGLKFVARNFPVGEVWEGSRIESKDYWELHRSLFEKEVPVRFFKNTSYQTVLGGARVKVLAHPQPADKDDLNDESLVFRLEYGNFSILFTGDIGFEAESDILLLKENIKSTVLKVPHHGSRFSSSESFLDAVAPEYALISAGYHNSFHLPASQTLEKLQSRGVRVYRTDFDGTIQMISDEKMGTLLINSIPGHFN